MAKRYQLLRTGGVKIIEGGHGCVPEDERNADWKDYLAWVATGNTPDPPSPLPVPLTPEEDVERKLGSPFVRGLIAVMAEEKGVTPRTIANRIKEKARTMIPLLLLALLLASPAAAWTDVNLVPGDSSTHDIVAPSDADPNRLNTKRCGPQSWIKLIPDITDESGVAANGITLLLFACSEAASTAAAGCRQLYDTGRDTGTLDGVSTTGTATFYGHPGSFLFVDVQAAPTSGTARVEVHCQ